MGQYRLNIAINTKDLAAIRKANQKVTAIRHMEEGNDYKVAWIAFDPYEENTLEWDAQYALYASKTELSGSMNIQRLSSTPASPGILYKFWNGLFQDPAAQDIAAEGTYSVLNEASDDPGLIFGLCQEISMNGQRYPFNPISARRVLFGKAANMKPSGKISIFLHNSASSASLVNHIHSEPLILSFSQNPCERSVYYQRNTGSFACYQE